ncbi:hypothetical protein CMUS01_07922 [Colletotrichum musicola]|uniref:Uncharacterized protein n=1 Tax=Colletotrichum musicola TaxID=2175873 RepID=A0A8H6NEL2_9PEZI|nr:hypothetical protein CMUS01_07922 [Colletotrichum musicola]
MCVFWIYQYIWYPFMARRERTQRAKEQKAREKAAQEREERKADPAPYQGGFCRRMATAKKNRELQVKNYHARCAAEDAAEQAEKAEKQAADKNAAEKDANVKNAANENAAEDSIENTTDNHDQSVSSSSTAGRSVHFPEATRIAAPEATRNAAPEATRETAPVTAHDATHDAPHEQTASKKSFRKVVGAMTSGFQRFNRNREEGRREQGQREQGQRRNGIQLRNLFKKKYTGPPMEYYM